MNLILPRQVLPSGSNNQNQNYNFNTSFDNKTLAYKNVTGKERFLNKSLLKSRSQALSLVHAATSLITSYFSGQPCLISKPTFTYTSDTVTIQVFYYMPNVQNSLNHKDAGKASSSLSNKITDLDTDSLTSLSTCLAHLYQKEVKLQVTRLHYPYMNSNILAQYLCHNAPSNTFINFQEAILTYPSLNASNLPSYINGIKIRLAGRLVTEPLVPRMTTKNSVRAKRSFTNCTNASTFTLDKHVMKQSAMIDYAKYTYKNELGAFTIKVWIGTTG